MELTHEFAVAIPVEQAWDVLTDLERIAPCMPGAELQEIEGDEHRGVIKVKVGPLTARYRGTARLRERDEVARRVVLVAEGRDTRGQGNASATVTAVLVATDDGTRVSIATDLHLSGKVAQFGRGALADVSEALLAEFVDRLEADITASAPATRLADSDADVDPPSEGDDEAGIEADAEATEAATVRRLPTTEVEPVDLLQTAGAPLAKRVVPAAIVVAVVVLVVWWRRRAR